MNNRSAYGRAVSAGRWAFAEFDALSTMYALGVPVPYPVQINGTEILMEFIGDGMTAAPRLAQVRATPAELDVYFAQVPAIMSAFARAGVAHGDLAAYNLLMHGGRVVVIDLPQLVDVAGNPNGLALLHRDCVNVCGWFARRDADHAPDEIFTELVAEMFG